MDDPTEAMRLVAAGEPVVLVVPSPPVCVTAGPGRLAIFVGSPEEPDTWAKAKAMGEEVFADWKSAVAPRPGTPTPTGRSEGPPELREAWKRSGT